MRKGMCGARVRYCGHAGYFVADIIGVANAWVIRANGKVTPDNIIRHDVDEQATHHVVDMYGGFWRPDLGVFVVPDEGLFLLAPGKAILRERREHKAAKKEKVAA